MSTRELLCSIQVRYVYCSHTVLYNTDNWDKTSSNIFSRYHVYHVHSLNPCVHQHQTLPGPQRHARKHWSGLTLDLRFWFPWHSEEAWSDSLLFAASSCFGRSILLWRRTDLVCVQCILYPWMLWNWHELTTRVTSFFTWIVLFSWHTFAKC